MATFADFPLFHRQWKCLDKVNAPTYEPRVSAIVLDGEAKEVVLEATNGVGLRLHGQSSFYLKFVAVGDQRPSTPAVGADPREGARSVAAPHSPHHTGNLLVRAEDDAAWK